MVDVTTQNFSDIFKRIKEELPRCSFVAIDAEFTGLLHGQERDNMFDTPGERYTRHRELGSEFIINQFGLCLTEETEEGFTTRPYNFYLYPLERYNVPRRDDTWFVCQASSLKMLAQFGFDFNKWIRDGIRYVSEAKGSTQPKWRTPTVPPNPSSEDTPSLVRTPVQTLKGMARNPDQESFVDQARRDLLTFTHNNDSREIKIKTLNRFERKVVYTLIEDDATISKTPLVTEKAMDEGREVDILVKKVSQEEMASRQKIRGEKLKVKEELKLGFTRVIQLLFESGKPLVLHNGLLDLMNIYRQFVGPLPETFEQFKMAVSSRFRHIMDTKLLASSQPFSQNLSRTRLDEIFTDLVNTPGSVFERVTVHLPEEFLRYNTSGKALCHEAGYDAYMTSVCFVHMLHHMRKLVGKDSESTDGPSDSLMAVAPFRNRIAMGFCDVEYIDFHGADPLPPRENVFHLSFSPTTRADAISDLFAPFSPIDIHWIDDTHAYVSLKTCKRFQDCFKYVKSEGLDSKIEVQRYKDYRSDLYTAESAENDPLTDVPGGESSSSQGRKRSSHGLPSPPNAKREANTEDPLAGLSANSTEQDNNVHKLFAEVDEW